MTTFSRRAVSLAILTTASDIASSMGLIGLSTSVVRAQLPATSEVSVEQWMSEWMSAEKPVAGALHISRFKDPIYFLLKPIAWNPPSGDSSLPHVEVPKGFVTDFASIPRIFWSLLRPDGEYTYPAIIHDYLYWTQTTMRQSADLVFRKAMEDFRIDTPTALTIYNAVRVGGGSAWQSNAHERARGEKRVLKRFPEDPTISWDEWKKEPDVFSEDMR